MATIHNEIEDALLEVLGFSRIVLVNRIGRIAQHKASDGTSASLEDKYWLRKVHSTAAPADATTGSMPSSESSRGVHIVDPAKTPSLSCRG